MRILNTKRAVALAVAFTALMEICPFPLSAGPKPQSAPQRQTQEGAQKPAIEVGQKTSEATISIETALVNLDVLVTDQEGRVLSGLKRENFRVLDNGKPQMITHFEPTSAPITIAILMEYSGRAYNYFAYKAASWGLNFLNHLDPLDWVALVTYDIKPTVQQDFTRNKAQVQQTLGSLSYPQFREANMYDAIIDTLDRLDRVKGKKAVLLISTGANTMSAGTLDETLKRVKQSDVTVFSVGLAESEHLHAGAAIGYLQAKNQLQTFAKLSGGTAWFPRFEGEIPDIFKSVAAFLRSQYSLGFSPKHLVHDGKYHTLRVEIVQPDGNPLTVTDLNGKRQKLIVYTREGFMAPRERTASSSDK
jgi:VWFA-related protein